MDGKLYEYGALTHNRIWLERTKGIGVISGRAPSRSACGPPLRGSSVPRDVRKDGLRRCDGSIRCADWHGRRTAIAIWSGWRFKRSVDCPSSQEGIPEGPLSARFPPDQTARGRPITRSNRPGELGYSSSATEVDQPIPVPRAYARSATSRPAHVN
jgi:hypothetical protein